MLLLLALLFLTAAAGDASIPATMAPPTAKDKLAAARALAGLTPGTAPSERAL